MKFVIQTPKKALKAFLKQRPSESERDKFKANLIALLDKISVIEKQPKDESEEHLKNNLRDFLRDTYYIETNAINTKDKKDLVIHNGKSTDTDVAVIIEAKRPSNIKEMVSADNANKKALHELILYYLNERNQSNNIQLKQLIITNVYEWFIIDANQFDKHIYRNTQIKKLYETKLNDKKDNPWFYEEISKIVANIDDEIHCVHFDIRDYDRILRNNITEDDKELVALYKILSPQHLLKIASPNDSNTLNERFYKELLYIIGLEEAREGTKNVIRRKKENKNVASLIELTIEALKTEDTFHRIPDIKVYGENNEEQTFNIALELCITWINRILFLKLLEGQLISYHQGNKDYRFLNSETIHDYDELFNLFHKVLAVNISERTEANKDKFSRVPYLNSSLFEISELEDQTIKINSLDTNGQLELINTTVLKEVKKKVDALPSLNYLFQFLDAYDFSGEGTENWQKDNKLLINASVLGKVFEKINGYKDGSIYTPAFITMYMCRQSIRLAVVEKFNEALSEKGKRLFDKFDDIKNYTSRHFKTEEVLKANEIINSLHICDPAVGSGHFLVSALNEIIAIKAELGILADDKGNNISGYEIEIVNDELIITDQQGNIVEYKLQNGKPANKEVQRLQKILFHQKETIIENCLFGVDINPKSVLICRLRLWIELLKNAYYKEAEYTELETLPNIDINIKCGNSLLSRFALNDDLTKALKSIKYDIKAYRGFVNEYKCEKNREIKRGLQKIIDTIKSDFKTEIVKSGKEYQNWYKAKGELEVLTLQTNLFQKTPAEKKKWNEDVTTLTEKIKKYEAILDEIRTNVIYKNAFEWRFEFPEVLNNKGEFEGFDLIIGNPPYIESRSSVIDEKLKDEIIRNIELRRKKDAILITRGSDILIYFFELGLCLLRKEGYLSFITQNSWLDTDYGFKFQKFLKNNTEVIGVFDNDIKYFDESANINTIITLFKGNKGNDTNLINFVRFDVGFEKAPYEPKEIASIQEIGKVIKVQQNDEMLNSIKWGIILNSDELIMNLQKRLFENKDKFNQNYRIGQGLNLTKDHILSKELAKELNLLNSSLVPFFTNDDGAPYAFSKTENFLVIGDGLSEAKKMEIQSKGIRITEINTSTRQIPTLILPRGLGRYFCAINNCNSYSSSFVEIYLSNDVMIEAHTKYLWLFLNSSIGWLIREISGRKNLGGGMLKAEAIDLKSYPLLFDFNYSLTEINKIYKTASKRQTENALIEINSDEHKEIDEIVFSKFGYNQAERKKIIGKLYDLIDLRVTKSKTKI